jgi:16S rRNA (cytidine1402-2'-O)-methyltransferase
MPLGNVYLLPNVLVNDDAQALACLPSYIQQQAAECHCFFVETLTTARRYLKKIWPAIVIDNYPFTVIHKCEQEVVTQFAQALKAGKNIGIISDAGCPGIADPGQILVEHAQKLGAKIVPLVGPNSILLALMASGMNGQSFQFVGYLPIDKPTAKKPFFN